jgi:hypothetical protein
MRSICIVIFLLSFGAGKAQDKPESGVQATIERFFEGFHKRDTALMRSVMGREVFMQRIGRTPTGTPALKNESMEDFLTSMANLPDTLQIQERLLDYRIQTDGDMAHAWTPYEFYLEGKLHHCGVNSFQLFHDGSGWKIIYLVDTRRVEDCKS